MQGFARSDDVKKLNVCLTTQSICAFVIDRFRKKPHKPAEVAAIIPAQRRALILTLLERRQQLDVRELALELSVSKETVRRDLTMLDSQYRLRRVHGGAVSVQTATEEAFNRRLDLNPQGKARIAARAAALFATGDSLFIDAGTTTTALATALAQTGGLTIVTNSIEVAARLWAGPAENHIYLLGGTYSGEVGETLGPDTVQQVYKFRTDHAVLTIGAVDAVGGFMDYNVNEAMVAAAMVEQTRSVTVLADHAKLGRTALVKVCELGRVARLVTDATPPQRLQEHLDKAGVEVFVT